MDKIWIDLKNRSIGGVTTVGGFKAQMEKLKAEIGIKDERGNDFESVIYRLKSKEDIKNNYDPIIRKRIKK